MIWPRWWAHFLALKDGYFWLPCPVCGKKFAGFEAGVYSVWEENSYLGRVACEKKACQAVALASTRASVDVFTYEFVNAFNGKRTPVTPKPGGSNR